MWIVRAMAYAAAACGGIAPSHSNEIFRCVIVESRYITDEGKQGVYPRDAYAGQIVIADTRSALVRIFGNPQQFVVAQSGSKVNSWILTRLNRGVVSTSVQLLAIQVYKPTIPFVLADGLMTISGNCTVVQ